MSRWQHYFLQYWALETLTYSNRLYVFLGEEDIWKMAVDPFTVDSEHLAMFQKIWVNQYYV